RATDAACRRPSHRGGRARRRDRRGVHRGRGRPGAVGGDPGHHALAGGAHGVLGDPRGRVPHGAVDRRQLGAAAPRAVHGRPHRRVLAGARHRLARRGRVVADRHVLGADVQSRAGCRAARCAIARGAGGGGEALGRQRRALLHHRADHLDARHRPPGRVHRRSDLLPRERRLRAGRLVVDAALGEVAAAHCRRGLRRQRRTPVHPRRSARALCAGARGPHVTARTGAALHPHHAGGVCKVRVGWRNTGETRVSRSRPGGRGLSVRAPAAIHPAVPPQETRMFRNRLSALLLVAALALPHAAAAPVAAQALAEARAASRWADAIAQGRATVAAVMAEHGIPGLSVAVLVDGAVVWSEGFGYANIEHRVPVTPLTRLRIGSVSKPVTAAALGKLVEQGRLDLDAPVQRYVPSFPEKRWPITTRQLAGHLAGIRHYRGDEFLSRDRYETVLDGLAIFQDDSLLFEPGTRYSYSSYGWNLISAVIEGAAGEPFLAYMQREVFDPLGLRSIVAEHTDSIIAHRASFYERDRETSRVL